MKRTQSNRQANFKSSLGPDALMLNSMFAREQVSGLFEFELTVASEDENIDLYAILGEHSRVELELPGGDIRYFSGHIAEFSFTSFRDNLAEYRLVLRPWLWLLTRASNNRIFQGKTVPDIIKQVCQDHGFTDIENRLSEQYTERVFCVQYNETDFDFISRLMEEEGIYYFFEHAEDKHTMVMADGPSAHETFGKYDVVPWYPPDAHEHREREHLDDWSMARGVRSGKFTQRDYDFTKPGANLEVVSRIAKPHAQAEFEQYHYPGGYTAVQRGETIARNRLEAVQADHEILAGRGNARGLIPGFLFALELFPRDDQNREYLILNVTHNLHQGGYDSGGADAGEDFEYGCSLQAMPSSEPYRPPRTIPRPVVYGPQTAIVVGDAGEEIWTNEHGQVKVQFHWDREGSNDQNSSCWVRVSQAWAGKQWGAQFLPRIGHEVIVEFLEGDPDRPIVTGSVYNGKNKPPYELPANATQSGIKTRSSKSGTGENYNEIRFEDKKGAEELYIHAEKDMVTRVENDDTITVDHDRTETVQNNETVTVCNNRDHTVQVNNDLTVGVNHTETVGANRSLTVGANEDRTITGSSTETIIGAWTNTTTGGITITSPMPINLTSSTAINLTAPNYTKSDANVYDMAAYSLSFIGSGNGFEGDHLDVRGLSKGLMGINMGANGVNIGTNGVDLSGSKVEIKSAKLSAMKKTVKLSDVPMELKKGALKLGKGALDISKKALTIKS